MPFTFPREIGLKRTVCTDKDRLQSYVSGIMGVSSCYTSLYSFKRLEESWRTRVDYSSAIIDRAWWDFDTVGDIDDVKRDVATLCSRLEGDFRIIATGRGFHVHLLFNKPVVGREWAMHLQRFERQKAKGLKTLDGVGYPEKITRIPDTYNPKRNRWCVVIDHLAFLESPLEYSIPNKPIPDLKVLCPYRGDRRPQEGFDFIWWCNTHPLTVSAEESRPATFLGGAVDDIPIPPCLDGAINTDNPPHEMRVALAQHLSENLRWFRPPESFSKEDKAKIEDQICEYISKLNWRDYNPHRTRAGVRSCMNYKGAPSCAWFEVRGICPGPCWRDDGTRRFANEG